MHRLALLVLLAGCVPLSYAFTPASNRPINPKPEGCKFDLHTSQPQNSYEEIGELKHYNGPAPKNVDKFRSAVADQVCQGGGDAVIATANAKGEYTLGMVIATPACRPSRSSQSRRCPRCSSRTRRTRTRNRSRAPTLHAPHRYASSAATR
jgi:hypothetical protein